MRGYLRSSVHQPPLPRLPPSPPAHQPWAVAVRSPNARMQGRQRASPPLPFLPPSPFLHSTLLPALRLSRPTHQPWLAAVKPHRAWVFAHQCSLAPAFPFLPSFTPPLSALHPPPAPPLPCPTHQPWAVAARPPHARVLARQPPCRQPDRLLRHAPDLHQLCPFASPEIAGAQQQVACPACGVPKGPCLLHVFQHSDGICEKVPEWDDQALNIQHTIGIVSLIP